MARKNILKKNELLAKVSEMDSLISPLFYEIMDYEDISVYKEKLISTKIDLLSLKMNEVIEYAQAYFMQEADNITKKQKRFFRTLIILFILSIIFPVLWIVTLIYFSKTTDELKKLINEFKNDGSDILVNQISIMLENCKTFLNVKVKKREEKVAESRDRDLNYELVVTANYVLNIYLESGVLLPITDNIRVVLIRILQEELQISEENLEELLKIAKTRVLEEMLKDELKLGRKLPQNSEF